jgi:hypothetical protein
MQCVVVAKGHFGNVLFKGLVVLVIDSRKVPIVGINGSTFIGQTQHNRRITCRKKKSNQREANQKEIEGNFEPLVAKYFPHRNETIIGLRK